MITNKINVWPHKSSSCDLNGFLAWFLSFILQRKKTKVFSFFFVFFTRPSSDTWRVMFIANFVSLFRLFCKYVATFLKCIQNPADLNVGSMSCYFYRWLTHDAWLLLGVICILSRNECAIPFDHIEWYDSIKRE